MFRDEALRRVKKRRAFHTNAFAYLVVNLVLWALWVITGVISGGGVLPVSSAERRSK